MVDGTLAKRLLAVKATVGFLAGTVIGFSVRCSSDAAGDACTASIGKVSDCDLFGKR